MPVLFRLCPIRLRAQPHPRIGVNAKRHELLNRATQRQSKDAARRILHSLRQTFAQRCSPLQGLPRIKLLHEQQQQIGRHIVLQLLYNSHTPLDRVSDDVRIHTSLCLVTVNYPLYLGLFIFLLLPQLCCGKEDGRFSYGIEQKGTMI